MKPVDAKPVSKLASAGLPFRTPVMVGYATGIPLNPIAFESKRSCPAVVEVYDVPLALTYKPCDPMNAGLCSAVKTIEAAPLKLPVFSVTANPVEVRVRKV